MSQKRAKKVNRVYKKEARKLLASRYGDYAKQQARENTILRGICFVLFTLGAGLVAVIIYLLIGV